MLPKVYRQRYQDLQQALEQLQQLTTSVLNVPKFQKDLLETQQLFQQQILSLDADELDPKEEPQVRSYQTEIGKQLRLLGMDVMFLQAARKSETLQQRQIQLSDRLVVLIGYCDALLGEKS